MMSQRLEQIWNHPVYREIYQVLTIYEKDREFCRHGMDHFLDVARIAYIRNLEAGLGLEKDLIYAAALLHDIGKAVQYQNGIGHEKAGAYIAENILDDMGPGLAFSEGDKKRIIAAIESHRDGEGNTDPLGRLLYESDKLSRKCYLCEARKECNWSDDKKNKGIEV